MRTWFERNSNDEYHSGDGVSSSELVQLLRSPAYYLAQREGRVETPEMRLGTYIHQAVLEPEEFNPEAIEVLDGRLKAGGDAWLRKRDEWLAQIIACRDAVHQCDEAMDLLAEGESELSCYLDADGIVRKCRADRINRKAGRILDLKTTSAETSEDLVRAVLRYRYDVSQANYREITGLALFDGILMPDFYWIFVQKQPPYNVWVRKPSQGMLEHGLACVRDAMELYKKCRVTGAWPKEPAGPEIMEYPKWFGGQYVE